MDINSLWGDIYSAWGKSQYQNWAEAAAKQYNVDPIIFAGLIQAESGWQSNAVSPTGAIGLTQLLPSTAAELGVDPNDPYQNLQGGAKYLGQQLQTFGGDYVKALEAYNLGPGKVQDILKAGGQWPTDSSGKTYADRVYAAMGKARPASDVNTPQQSNTPSWLQGIMPKAPNWFNTHSAIYLIIAATTFVFGINKLIKA